MRTKVVYLLGAGCSAGLGLPVTADFLARARDLLDQSDSKMDQLMVDDFLDAHDDIPEQIILDLDATDDPIHGHQEGRFFHGYYDCYCYLPLYIFCGEVLLSAQLRTAGIDPAKGALMDLKRVVAQIRKRWPRVHILVRGDSGFCQDAIMDWCERHGLDYVFGLAKNARLLKEIAKELKQAEAESLKTGEMPGFSRASTIRHWRR